MTSPAAVDLAPLGHMLLVGTMLVAAAVAWLWVRRHGRPGWPWRHRVTVLTLLLTFDLVVFGAFTRLSDSGLGCPDWPGCYGHGSPVGAALQISAAQSALPTGPVTHGKAWIEMVHRYLATGVGGLILLLAVASWRGSPAGENPTSRMMRWLPTLTLVWVCVQGAFGALTVTMKLRPAIVTLHLLGGLALLALLCVQAERDQQRRASGSVVLLDPLSRLLLRATCTVLVLQLALGGWVSTNYAVLACTDFPTCQNSWWPEMRFDQAFQFWRELGMTPQGDHISFPALTAIHMAHRLMAGAVLLVVGWLVLRLSCVATLRRPAQWLGALGLLQLASGLGNVILGWPMVAALLHTAGAAGLVMVLTWVVARTAVEVPVHNVSTLTTSRASA